MLCCVKWNPRRIPASATMAARLMLSLSSPISSAYSAAADDQISCKTFFLRFRDKSESAVDESENASEKYCAARKTVIPSLHLRRRRETGSGPPGSSDGEHLSPCRDRMRGLPKGERRDTKADANGTVPDGGTN